MKNTSALQRMCLKFLIDIYSSVGFSGLSLRSLSRSPQGGRHVDYVADQLVTKLIDVVKKKNKNGVGVKPFQVKCQNLPCGKQNLNITANCNFSLMHNCINYISIVQTIYIRLLIMAVSYFSQFTSLCLSNAFVVTVSQCRCTKPHYLLDNTY